MTNPISSTYLYQNQRLTPILSEKHDQDLDSLYLYSINLLNKSNLLKYKSMIETFIRFTFILLIY